MCSSITLAEHVPRTALYARPLVHVSSVSVATDSLMGSVRRFVWYQTARYVQRRTQTVVLHVTRTMGSILQDSANYVLTRWDVCAVRQRASAQPVPVVRGRTSASLVVGHVRSFALVVPPPVRVNVINASLDTSCSLPDSVSQKPVLLHVRTVERVLCLEQRRTASVRVDILELTVP